MNEFSRHEPKPSVGKTGAANSLSLSADTRRFVFRLVHPLENFDSTVKIVTGN
jgi:hypothetical protein